MARIRQVLQHSESKKWAFVETSDEDKKHVVIMGDKEFDDKAEAEEWAKGFAMDSYVYVDPKTARRSRLEAELIGLKDRLQEVEKELEDLA